jgi:transcriptional regulator of acetoin/glycerol metabolism
MSPQKGEAMSWKARLVRQLLRLANRQDMEAVAVEAAQRWAETIPPEERAAFAQRLIESQLPVLLKGMDRELRAGLMNALLPALAREFPLADLDILAAFPKPEDSHRPYDAAS